MMIDLQQYRGITQFGPAWQVILENDTHAPGSVDRAIADDMIRVCPETAEYLYAKHTPLKLLYEKGSRPCLEGYVARATVDGASIEERAAGIIRLCSQLKEDTDDDVGAMCFGGTEEELIQRGSDWCGDVARVACAVCQVGGIPARLAYLVDMDQAYSGHVIIEAHRDGVWGPQTH